MQEQLQVFIYEISDYSIIDIRNGTAIQSLTYSKAKSEIVLSYFVLGSLT